MRSQPVAVGWPSGLRRQFQALVSSEAWVRIPLQSICFFFGRDVPENKKPEKTKRTRTKQKVPRLGIAPRLPRPQRGVLLLYYLGDLDARRPRGTRIFASAITEPRAALPAATLAKRLMRLPRKQKVVSSNLTGGYFCFHDAVWR